MPNLMTEDKIIHALRALMTSIGITAPAANDAQLQAIAALRDIFRSYGTTRPRVDLHPRPPTPSPPRVRPTTLPTAHTTPEPTANPWIPVPARVRSALNAPIATRRRARQAASCNAFAALADTELPDTAPVAALAEAEPPLSPRVRPTAQPATTTTGELTTNPWMNALSEIKPLPALRDDPTTPMAMPVLNDETGKTLELRQLRQHPKYKAVWDTSYADKLGRLCQGIGKDAKDPTKPRVSGTNTFRPICYQDIPTERRNEITYSCVVCEVRPQKDDPNQTCITIGGDRICYPGDTGTKTGSIELVKTLLNSVVSRPGVRFACFDLKNFYLGTPLDRPEYVEFIDKYRLNAYAHNGWVYFEITNGVYGLKQAGKLANDLLTTRLEAHGYHQCKTTPGLWRHRWHPVVFVLIVDDFGIEYVERRHADHLLAALKETYQVTTNWTGAKFAGIDITWDYAKHTCRITMKDYIANVLLKYNHKKTANVAR
jgi:hypothetical protein